MHAQPASLLVIFGATGDLAQRMLLPSVYGLHRDGHLPPYFRLLGTARSELDDAGFRQMVAQTIAERVPEADRDEASLKALLDRIEYQPAVLGDESSFASLAERIRNLRDGDVVFHLSTAPKFYSAICAALAEHGLADSGTRVLLEKPIGHDLASAVEINDGVARSFDEERVYRVDHYLGKEGVQNLIALRFGNALFEPLWNARHIEQVQITVAETVGVEGRGDYYDDSGAMRDMLQNHLLQLLCLTAMEPPSQFDPSAVRNEKIKVLRSLRPLSDDDVIRGQYTAGEVKGEAVRGYLDEDGVPAGSQTETFVALRMFVDSWRWKNVPFYLRTGKCMPHKTTQIAVRFHGAPVSFFEQHGCTQDTHDVLTITLQPHEGFAFYLDIKKPGAQLQLERIPLRFHYEGYFDGAIPDAYTTLLLDVLEGDQTLFVHGDEVEESWRTYARLIESPPPVHGYAAGTWGPPEADHLAIPERDLWQRPKV